MNRAKSFLGKKAQFLQKEVVFLPLCLITFIFLRMPSLWEPAWYGDEAIYQVIGMALNEGRVLYLDIWDNKPPLLYWIYAFAHADLFSVKLLSLLAGLLSVIVFFLLAKVVLKKTPAVYLATAVYSVLFGLPLLEGNIANAENFMHLPIFLAFFILLFSLQKISGRSYTKKLFFPFAFAGLLLSIAFSIKIVALFDFLALFIMAFTMMLPEKISLQSITKMVWEKGHLFLIFLLSFTVTPLLFILYFAYHHALAEYLAGVYFSNVGYVNVENHFIIPLGLVSIKAIVAFIAIVLVVLSRKRLSMSGLVIYIWCIFSLFSTFFSDRPYTHYMLMFLPAFSLLLGYVIQVKKKAQIVAMSIVVGSTVLLWWQFPLYTKVGAYYQNAVDFVLRTKSVEAYQAFFDASTPQDYALAQFIQSYTTKNDTIFVWSDHAQIYSLSDKLPPGKYAVAYHITFYENALKQTQDVLSFTRPKLIIQTKNTPEIKYFLPGYRLQYKMGEALIYEREI